MNKNILILGLAAVVSLGVSAHDDPHHDTNPTCDTFTPNPAYYVETKTIKVPWLEYAGDASNTRYCAIFVDEDDDGRYNIESFDVTGFRPENHKVTIDQANGTAFISMFEWIEADGSVPYLAEATLRREDDGQFVLEGLILTPNDHE